jgi:hypothetical protein
MCNLYSITTNQAAIAALFRVVNPYVGNLAPMRRVPGLSGPGDPQHGHGHRDDADALGHAATPADWRPAGHEHPQPSRRTGEAG